jgi:hypothetical protein
MSHRCCRCSAPASCVMAYDYDSRMVWLGDAVTPVAYGSYALCEDHARRLSTPADWTLTDARELAPSLPLTYDVA